VSEVEFLVDGEWCCVDYFAEQAPAVKARTGDFWSELYWQPLGLLAVKHPKHGTVSIVPRYFAWRQVSA
jgi:hypothetical protein